MVRTLNRVETFITLFWIVSTGLRSFSGTSGCWSPPIDSSKSPGPMSPFSKKLLYEDTLLRIESALPTFLLTLTAGISGIAGMGGILLKPGLGRAPGVPGWLEPKDLSAEPLPLVVKTRGAKRTRMTRIDGMQAQMTPTVISTVDQIETLQKSQVILDDSRNWIRDDRRMMLITVAL